MARYIMAGRLQAISFVVLFSVLALFMPPLSVFSNAAVALVTLRLGWQQGLLLAIVGTLALSLLTFLLEQNLNAGFLIGFIQWSPVVIIATVLYQTVSWTQALRAVLGIAAAGILLFHALIPDTASFWREVLGQSVKPLLEASNDPELDVEQWVMTVAQWMTGITAAVMSIIWVVSLIMARYWQAQLYNPGGFGEEFRELRLGRITAIIMLLVIAVSVVTQHKVAIEILMTGIAVFLFQGLSLVHAMVKRFEVHPVALFVLYIMLFTLPVHVAVLLAAFGIIDGFADFRTKLIKEN